MEVDDPIPQVDWDNLQIVESHDEEGRIELLSENQIYVLLGLRDEESAHVAAPNDRSMDMQSVDNDNDAAIPTSDVIPSELVISYDKDHPKMDLGTIFPSMKEFRMAVRQFAISEEFDLGTEKSDPTRFRGFCKSTGDYPWKINGSKHKGASTVEVKIFLCSSDLDYLIC